MVSFRGFFNKIKEGFKKAGSAIRHPRESIGKFRESRKPVMLRVFVRGDARFVKVRGKDREIAEKYNEYIYDWRIKGDKESLEKLKEFEKIKDVYGNEYYLETDPDVLNNIIGNIEIPDIKENTKKSSSP